ncbi:Hsp20/alpha crystallin family protein [Benzoatithermus flavus]|uniref:Hsp20/alpha crystallin family protein n=1 Tax=Benzoatithermus flavus TaxID=3108223 RepID=A0ABU8XQJ8_9PROT
MGRDEMRNRMWAQALELLDRAERVHRAMFRPGSGGQPASGPTCWEPPVDVLEVDGAIWIQVMLPGVSPEQVEIRIEGNQLVVAGERSLPLPPGTGVIHRLETPYGCFERRITLPPGHYEIGRRDLTLGCLTLTLRKIG